MKIDAIAPKQAAKILEALRVGIPPAGYLEFFTVGRNDQIERLNSHLTGGGGYALLLKANYGSGKSHLLQMIREKAVVSQFATSLVILDANSGVRFNRMDQILGAILQNLKIDNNGGSSNGLARTLDFLADSAERAKSNSNTKSYRFWAEVTNNWKWDSSAKLMSPALFVAFRAWAATKSQPVRDLIIDWLSFPANYRTQRKKLYRALVSDLNTHFRDPRSDYQIYSDGVVSFHTSQYKSCWNALEDINQMCSAAGLKGMVILFDEFEDVLTNINNINHKEAAFGNLFRFVSGNPFTGKTFYAVTPSFIQRCVNLLITNNRWNFDYGQFDNLETFEMSPLSEQNLLDLAERIAAVHERAYSYKITPNTKAKIKRKVIEAAKSVVQDRARQAIKQAVGVLDDDLPK